MLKGFLKTYVLALANPINLDRAVKNENGQFYVLRIVPNICGKNFSLIE
jgi:hypothetical protein